jgi:hypothetical protein
LHPGVIFVIEERLHTSQILPTITYICLISNKGTKTAFTQKSDTLHRKHKECNRPHNIHNVTANENETG